MRLPVAIIINKLKIFCFCFFNLQRIEIYLAHSSGSWEVQEHGTNICWVFFLHHNMAEASNDETGWELGFQRSSGQPPLIFEWLNWGPEQSCVKSQCVVSQIPSFSVLPLPCQPVWQVQWNAHWRTLSAVISLLRLVLGILGSAPCTARQVLYYWAASPALCKCISIEPILVLLAATNCARSLQNSFKYPFF